MERQIGKWAAQGVLLAILLALLIPFTLAEKQSVFSGEVYSGGTDVTDLGENFSVYLNIEETAALITFSDAEYIIERFDCDTKNNRTVCVNNFSDTRDGSMIWTLTPKVSLDISQDLTGVSIIKTSSTKKLNLYEFADVKIKLQALDKDLSSAELSEEHPSDVEIFDLDGCEVDSENTVTWTGELLKTSSHTCSYSFKALDEEDFTVTTEVTYNNGVKELTQTYLESYSISGPAIDINLTVFHEKENKTYTNATPHLILKLGDVVTAAANMTIEKGVYINNYSFSWNTNFKVLSRNRDSFYYQNFMQQGMVMGYGAKLRAVRNGTGTFYTKGVYVYAGRENFVDKEIPYEVVVEVPTTSHSFDGAKKTFTAELANPTNLTFYNITINISSPDGQFRNRTIPNTPPFGYGELTKALTDEEIADDELTVSYTWYSEFGERFFKKEKVSVSGEVKEEIAPLAIEETSADQETPTETGAPVQPPKETTPVFEDKKTESAVEKVKSSISEQRKLLYIVLGSVFLLAILLVVFFMVRDRLKEKFGKKKEAAPAAPTAPEKREDPLYKQFGTATVGPPPSEPLPASPVTSLKEEVSGISVLEKDIKEDVKKMEKEESAPKKAAKPSAGKAHSKGKKPLKATNETNVKAQ